MRRISLAIIGLVLLAGAFAAEQDCLKSCVEGVCSQGIHNEEAIQGICVYKCQLEATEETVQNIKKLVSNYLTSQENEGKKTNTESQVVEATEKESGSPSSTEPQEHSTKEEQQPISEEKKEPEHLIKLPEGPMCRMGPVKMPEPEEVKLEECPVDPQTLDKIEEKTPVPEVETLNTEDNKIETIPLPAEPMKTEETTSEVSQIPVTPKELEQPLKVEEPVVEPDRLELAIPVIQEPAIQEPTIQNPAIQEHRQIILVVKSPLVQHRQMPWGFEQHRPRFHHEFRHMWRAAMRDHRRMQNRMMRTFNGGFPFANRRHGMFRGYQGFFGHHRHHGFAGQGFQMNRPHHGGFMNIMVRPRF